MNLWGMKRSGGSVMAAYQDALKYLDRFSDESVKEIGEDMEKHGFGGFVAGMALNTAKLDAAIETVAFIFGKTASQVRLDAMKLVFGKEHL